MKLKLTILLSLGTFSLLSQSLHLGTNGNVGIGNTNPQNKLEITTNTPNQSGLRLSNLTSTSTAEKNNGKVLSVNQSGDVISTESLLNNSIIWSEQETNDELTALGYKLIGATTLDFSEINTNSTGLQWIKNTSSVDNNNNSTSISYSNGSAIWTGSRMIIWGGQLASGSFINKGLSYNPLTDAWTPISTVNAPEARIKQSVIWTGSKMIIWGGLNGSTTFQDGGIYDPATDTWTSISTLNSPQVAYHLSVFTGTKMIVWGGSNNNGSSYVNTGSIYDISSNTWTSMSTLNAPFARPGFGYSGIWTGSKMIVWGGNTSSVGKMYDLQTNTWQNMSTINAPISRSFHQAVWTGSKMLIWGGSVPFANFANTGGIYDVATDSWTSMSTQNAPSGRFECSMVWTGKKLLIWGGIIYLGNNYVSTNDGGTYDIITDQWTPITSNTLARGVHKSVWTGDQLIAFAGQTTTNTGSNAVLYNGDIIGIKYLASTPKKMFLFKKQ